MSMKTVPTPPVIQDAYVHTAQAYPLRFTLHMAIQGASLDWDDLPWWRRALARWASKRDWGEACRGWAANVPIGEDERHHAVMVDREELKARFP